MYLSMKTKDDLFMWTKTLLWFVTSVNEKEKGLVKS